MRKLTTIGLLSIAPSAALADGTMPQMDFTNPLTLDQVGWMAVILVVLYLVLSRWGLPQIGKVIEHREAVIAQDLAAANARMDHGARVGVGQEIQNVILPGFEVDFHLGKAGHVRMAQAVARVIVPGDRH